MHGIKLTKNSYSTQPILADISHEISQSVIQSPILHNDSKDHKSQLKTLVEKSRDQVLIAAGRAEHRREGKPTKAPNAKEKTFVFIE